MPLLVRARLIPAAASSFCSYIFSAWTITHSSTLASSLGFTGGGGLAVFPHSPLATPLKYFKISARLLSLIYVKTQHLTFSRFSLATTCHARNVGWLKNTDWDELKNFAGLNIATWSNLNDENECDLIGNNFLTHPSLLETYWRRVH